MKKRGQITIFIILGLFIFFIFLMLISLTEKAKLNEIQQKHQKGILKTIEKEAIQIYVDDCISDELITGLQLIGKQGRIWQNQEGGTLPFTGETGTTYLNNQVIYAISKQELPENQYPCRTDCEYQQSNENIIPSNSIKFGKINLNKDSVERDLQEYLKWKIEQCVNDFVAEKISPEAELITKEITLDLSIYEDGINIVIDYPLTFKLEEIEVFQLTRFSLIQPTQFGKLLRLATQNFLHEWSLSNFEFYTETSTNLLGQNIDIRLEKHEDQGNQIYIFKTPKTNIAPESEQLSDNDFIFQFAFQNRPPALEHISQCPGSDYDYVIVKDLDGEKLGTMEIELHAYDPDDNFEHYFSTPHQFLDIVGGKIIIDENIINEIHELTVTAQDTQQEKDAQTLKLLIEPKLVPTITFKNLKNEKINPLSQEDPFCLEINFPDSQTYNEISLTLNNHELTEGIYFIGLEEQPLFTESCLFDIENEELDLTDTKEHLASFLQTEENFISSGEVSYGEGEECKYEIDETISFPETTPCYPENICCLPDSENPPYGTIADSNIICYSGLTCQQNSNYYLSTQTQNCNGERGNLCNGEENTELIQITNSQDYQTWKTIYDIFLKENLDDEQYLRIQEASESEIDFTQATRNLCGITSSSCSQNIDEECQGLPENSFLINRDYGYWCYQEDNKPCQFCDDEIVYDDDGNFDDCGCEVLNDGGKNCLKLDDGTKGTCTAWFCS